MDKATAHITRMRAILKGEPVDAERIEAFIESNHLGPQSPARRTPPEPNPTAYRQGKNPYPCVRGCCEA